jgi:D-hydroxyproline dehydrogenase subunit alpha
MSREVRQQFDVLVVGGGPAGMSAAVFAAGERRRVGLVDDNPGLGGQIWRGGFWTRTSEAANWVEKLLAAGVELLCETRVFDQPGPKVLRAEGPDNFCELSYGKLILATGARERFLPYPGWTLPNVMGAGALQALVKSGLPISEKRVVVAGTGPLLLAVAAYLRSHGAEIPIICEQASWTSLAGFGLALLRQPEKISQGLSLRKELAGIPFATSCWPISAEGDEILKSVAISRDGTIEKISCDYLACGFHLVPNTELAMLLDCRLQNGYVETDEFQQTSVPGVFCAGEPTGIGGVELSLIEGQIAGSAATGRTEVAKKLFGKREKLRKFARALDRTFALRSELKTLPLPSTIVCRCEDVTYARLKRYASWRAAKLQTRCGMGPCQGRVCGPAMQFLLDWSPDSVRPPIFPTSCENLSAMTSNPELEHSEVTGGAR